MRSLRPIHRDGNRGNTRVRERRDQPEALLAVTRGRLQARRDQLREALRGRLRPHHRFRLRLHLDQIGSLEQAIQTVDTEVGATLAPFRERAACLTTMAGLSDVLAQVIVSEIGVDMSAAAGWQGATSENTGGI